MKLMMATLLANLIFNLNLYSQQQTGYIIEGHIKGLKDREKVLMTLVRNGMDLHPADSSYVRNEQFKVSGIVPEGPRLYWLSFEEHPGKFAVLFIKNQETIKISGENIAQIPSGNIREYISIQNSPTDFAYASLLNVDRLYFDENISLRNYLKKIKDSIGYNRDLVGGFIQLKKTIDATYHSIFMNPAPSCDAAKPLILTGHKAWLNNHAYFLKSVYDNLNDDLRNSFYGKLLKRQANICIGQTLPAFTLPDTDDKEVSLKDVFSSGKLTIVNIWASNSFNRRASQDELKQVYIKYHSLGLNIIGVSSDTSSIEWKLRIQADKIPWPNVSDLKGKIGIVGTTYDEYGQGDTPNTTNILLDSTGKILCWDAYGIELQWYIQKYLGE